MPGAGGFRPDGPADEADGADGADLGPLPYLVAALSTLPLVGLLFAAAAICWGLATLPRGGKAVALIGVVGVGTQFVLALGALYLTFGL